MKLNRILPFVLLLCAAMAFTSCDDGKKKAEDEKMAMDKEEAAAAEDAKMKETKMKEEAKANSIAGKAMASEDLDTLVAALKGADLASMMSEPGNYTVFAPTDNAFKKLPKGTIETLLKPESKEALTGILQYHVVSGKVTAAQLAEAIKSNKGKYSFKTVAGTELTAMMDGDQLVIKDGRGKKAHIVQGNIDASNGIVHKIDMVLMDKK